MKKRILTFVATLAALVAVNSTRAEWPQPIDAGSFPTTVKDEGTFPIWTQWPGQMMTNFSKIETNTTSSTYGWNEGYQSLPPANAIHCTEHGFARVWAEGFTSHSRMDHKLLWLSPHGERLIETLVDDRYGFSAVRIINSQQLLLVSPVAYRLYSATSPGNWTVVTYGGEEDPASRFRLDDYPVKGFYRFKDGEIIRVDFPAAPVVPASEVNLVLESAPSASGPWGVIGETTVPVDRTNALYRLRVSR